MKIEHIIETHLHADFVSCHHELAERTGARIYLGEGSDAAFPHLAVKDGDSIQFGNCRLDFMQTPGHTLESVCIALTGLGQRSESQPQALFRGPHAAGDSPRCCIRACKLLKLPDETEIFSGAWSCSLCGRQMSAERSSTIGNERRTNYALVARSPEEFIHLLTDSLPPRPEDFGKEVELNRRGAAALEQLPHPLRLHAPEVFRLQSAGAIVLDTRPTMHFAVAHFPGSVHIALSGQ